MSYRGIELYCRATRDECEKMGLRCVEKLLEKDITEDQLLKAVSGLVCCSHTPEVSGDIKYGVTLATSNASLL